MQQLSYQTEQYLKKLSLLIEPQLEEAPTGYVPRSLF